jgi:hypothetical protein
MINLTTSDEALGKLYQEKFIEIDAKSKDVTRTNMKRYIERLMQKKGCILNN